MTDVRWTPQEQAATVEDVEFCDCTNEELEAGRNCGQPQCPNRPGWHLAADHPIRQCRTDICGWPGPGEPGH